MADGMVEPGYEEEVEAVEGAIEEEPQAATPSLQDATEAAGERIDQQAPEQAGQPTEPEPPSQDAQRQQEWEKAYAADPRGMKRPQADKSLEALFPAINRQVPVVFNANTERDVVRAGQHRGLRHSVRIRIPAQPRPVAAHRLAFRVELYTTAVRCECQWA